MSLVAVGSISNALSCSTSGGNIQLLDHSEGLGNILIHAQPTSIFGQSVLPIFRVDHVFPDGTGITKPSPIEKNVSSGGFFYRSEEVRQRTAKACNCCRRSKVKVLVFL